MAAATALEAEFDSATSIRMSSRPLPLHCARRNDEARAFRIGESFRRYGDGRWLRRQRGARNACARARDRSSGRRGARRRGGDRWEDWMNARGRLESVGSVQTEENGLSMLSKKHYDASLRSEDVSIFDQRHVR
eukprot:6005428-Pleurochrysis_carterae.AAC.2